MPKIAIIWEDGNPVVIPAGGPIEADMIAILTKEINLYKGRWSGRINDAQVKQAIENALYKFKSQIKPVPIIPNK